MHSVKLCCMNRSNWTKYLDVNGEVLCRSSKEGWLAGGTQGPVGLCSYGGVSLGAGWCGA